MRDLQQKELPLSVTHPITFFIPSHLLPALARGGDGLTGIPGRAAATEVLLFVCFLNFWFPLYNFTVSGRRVGFCALWQLCAEGSESIPSYKAEPPSRVGRVVPTLKRGPWDSHGRARRPGWLRPLVSLSFCCSAVQFWFVLLRKKSSTGFS